MPVPPQESAPSLSPRQSFGCQSPLPWVTGTDRTGSLRALWQLQGSFQEFSSPSAHSLTWRSRSQANKPHAVQYCVITTTHGKHRQRLSQIGSAITDNLTVMFSEQGSTHRLAQLFPNNQGFFHSSSTQGFRFRKCAHGISQRQTQTPRSRDRVYMVLSGQTQAFFSVSGLHAGLLQTGLHGSPSGSRDRMDANPLHGLLHLFYLHAPGSTLVTLGTACVPSVRLPPTTWEITCPSKRT
jgi:hypothetical protein